MSSRVEVLVDSESVIVNLKEFTSIYLIVRYYCIHSCGTNAKHGGLSVLPTSFDLNVMTKIHYYWAWKGKKFASAIFIRKQALS